MLRLCANRRVPGTHVTRTRQSFASIGELTQLYACRILTICPGNFAPGSSSRDAPATRECAETNACECLFCCSLARLPGILSPSLDSASHLASSMAVGRCGSRVGSCGTATHAQSAGFAQASHEGSERRAHRCACTVLASRVNHQQRCNSARKIWSKLRSSRLPQEAGRLARLSSSLNCPPSRVWRRHTEARKQHIEKGPRCSFFEIPFRV